jgi:2,4-dienoyl-CoA reductase-like NADH-dependent reductase (Old Yellow Enzyme family)
LDSLRMNLFSHHPSLNLKNRAVMAPMTRIGCDKNGSPNFELGEYYVRRAQNDAGLIITESCAVNSTDAMGYKFGAQFHNNEHLEKWKPIIERVHQAGAKIWIQLFHAGRLTVPEITGGKVLSASSIKPYGYPSYWRPIVNDEIVHFQTKTPYTIPDEMAVHEIEKIINDFGNSVALADSAGFDGVEIHGAHGYLVHCFMSKLSNVRDDEFAPDNGNKFLRELITISRKNLKRDKILSFRCSVHMVDNPLIRFSEENIDFKSIIKMLDELGVDVFHSSEIDSKNKSFGSKNSLHEYIRQNTNKPIIICGGVKTLVAANRLLECDNNSLIAFGRNFISNPDLISLFKFDKESEIIPFNYEVHFEKIN